MKKKVDLPTATIIALGVKAFLEPACHRIEIAGSIRRRRVLVSDIEIVYVPKMKDCATCHGVAEKIPDDFFDFANHEINLADEKIKELMLVGMLARRKNCKGREAFGSQIKLMVDTKSGFSVDLFETREESWWNYLVCRTGGKDSNTRIAARAKERGYKWKPYSAGFEDRENGRIWPVHSEEEVFKFVGLDYEEPWERP